MHLNLIFVSSDKLDTKQTGRLYSEGLYSFSLQPKP